MQIEDKDTFKTYKNILISASDTRTKINNEESIKM